MDTQSQKIVDQLRNHFARFTRILYDTSVPMDVVTREIFPYLSSNVEFLDPLVRVRGWRTFEKGRRGFHCTFKFDFDIAQVGIQLDERGERGRAMVDGIMNLRSLIIYTYPLRTMLVYDFELKSEEPGLTITRIEELWSFGDLIANVPMVGGLYDAARRANGHLILGLFGLSCAIAKRLRPSFYY
ncbi:MAG TPA: hypothetical protein PK156_15100 [Polyangium sp.]|nr:hypothetical protein [Polyangium sp.]